MALCTALAVDHASAATLLPNGEQTFLDAGGAPLAGGKVYFYAPGTTTPKNTYQDSLQAISNLNPVALDAAGRAIIYGNGAYRQVVKDALGNVIWDQITADTSAGSASWAGTSGGAANAQTVTAGNFSAADGQVIGFRAGATNTGALTVNPNAAGAISVYKDTATGPIILAGGEVVAGNVAQVVYDSVLGGFHLVNPSSNQTLDAAKLSTYCYIGDGSSHTLSTVTSCNGVNTASFTLYQWQTIVPGAAALTDEIDGAAIQSVLNAATTAAAVVIPAQSTAVVNRQIVVPAGIQASFTGSGSNASVILFTNAAGGMQGIYQAPSDENIWLEVQGLAIETNVDQPSGTAISYQPTAASTGYARPVLIRDVFIGGTSKKFPFNHYWNIGVDLSQTNFGEITSFMIAGKGLTGSDISTPVSSSNMLYGIRVSAPAATPGTPSSDAMKIHDGLIYQSQTGVELDNDVEQTRISDVDIVAVNAGVNQTYPLGVGQEVSCAYVQNSHINAYVVDIAYYGCAEATVSNNLLYLLPPAGATAYGITLKSSQNDILLGNHFYAYVPSGATAEGVNIDNASHHNQVIGTNCNFMTYCFDTQGNTSTTIGPNVFKDTLLVGTATTNRAPSTNDVYYATDGLAIADEILPKLAINSATPNANFPSGIAQTLNNVPTNITSFPSAAYNGPEITIQCGDILTTFVNSGALVTTTGANVACAYGKIVKFKPIGGYMMQTQ